MFFLTNSCPAKFLGNLKKKRMKRLFGTCIYLHACTSILRFRVRTLICKLQNMHLVLTDEFAGKMHIICIVLMIFSTFLVPTNSSLTSASYSKALTSTSTTLFQHSDQKIIVVGWTKTWFSLFKHLTRQINSTWIASEEFN
jgi:hypothetical protein